MQWVCTFAFYSPILAIHERLTWRLFRATQELAFVVRGMNNAGSFEFLGLLGKDGIAMFLCLSSGATPRYREDVLRALSMPWGSVLQFRYLKRYVAPGILENTKSTNQAVSRAIIAHIDQTDPNKAPEIIPCRFASITDVTEVGTAVTLTLQLQEFAFADDLAKFNEELKQKARGTLPAWQTDGEKTKVRSETIQS